MLPPRFELGSQAREARVLDRARLRERIAPGGFEPPSEDPESPILGR